MQKIRRLSCGDLKDMYLIFTFTGDGGGLIGERERASATCRKVVVL